MNQGCNDSETKTAVAIKNVHNLESWFRLPKLRFAVPTTTTAASTLKVRLKVKLNEINMSELAKKIHVPQTGFFLASKTSVLQDF